MARPKNKADLLNLSKKNFELLIDFIERLSKEEQNKDFPKGTMNRNIRDVLMHLHHWHLMMFDWYTVGMKGEKPDIPAKGYTWKTTPELNRWVLGKYKDNPLEDTKNDFTSSYEKVRCLSA